MRIAVLAALGAGAVAPLCGAEPVVGSRVPEWTAKEWINAKPLRLADLEGEAVLVRWFTSEECPHCSATAPALNEFHQSYGRRGLRVIGFYHHKSARPLDLEEVRRTVRKYGFRFPVGIDREWKTLHAWWLDRGKQDWTSVTFLLDRRGIVRHVHPGGRYVKGDAAYQELRATIEQVLAEPKPHGTSREPASE
jgi:peroxiredoxin